jgi:ribosome-associated translation inhibitor RaiA
LKTRSRIEQSNAIEVHMRDKTERPETLLEPIIACRVVVEMQHQQTHQVRGPYRARRYHRARNGNRD